MKISLDKKQLSDILTNLLRSVSTKSTIPALEGILIKAYDEVEFTAYNLEIGMKTKTSAKISEEGSIILSAKLFTDIVRKAPSDIITISTNDKYLAEIESGMSNYKIIGINPDEFPEFPKIVNENSITLPSVTLKNMIRQTIFAVAENDSKPINQGSLFNIENGIFDMVSVDGYRLALKRERVDIKENVDFVVPGKALSEILKINSEEDVEITPERKHIMFKIGNYTLVSNIIEGEFIDYKKAIPNTSNTEIKINTSDFTESVERVSLLISEKLKSPVRCVFENNLINISCTTAIGKANDEVNCKTTGPEIEMGFNSKYLLDALRYCECDEIMLKMTGPVNPMVICPVDGDDFTFLVLPVRLRNE